VTRSLFESFGRIGSASAVSLAAAPIGIAILGGSLSEPVAGTLVGVGLGAILLGSKYGVIQAFIVWAIFIGCLALHTPFDHAVDPAPVDWIALAGVLTGYALTVATRLAVLVAAALTAALAVFVPAALYSLQAIPVALIAAIASYASAHVAGKALGSIGTPLSRIQLSGNSVLATFVAAYVLSAAYFATVYSTVAGTNGFTLLSGGHPSSFCEFLYFSACVLLGAGIVYMEPTSTSARVIFVGQMLVGFLWLVIYAGILFNYISSPRKEP